MTKPSEPFNRSNQESLVSDSLDIDTTRLDIYDFLSDEIIGKFDQVLDNEEISDEKAVESFLSIAQHYPENGYVAVCAAENIAAYGGDELALDMIEDVATEHPDNMMAGFSLSQMLLFAEQSEEAEDVFKNYTDKIMQKGRHVYAAEVIEWVYTNGILCAENGDVAGCKGAIAILQECCPGHHYIDDLTEMLD